MDAQIQSNLGENIRQLREARGLTQQQVSRLAGVPRPTWANLETGMANPTLAVLIKVATALQVRIEELLGPPRVSAQHYRAADLPVRTRGKIQVRKLLPEAVPGLEIERMELRPGASMTGIPHTPGTREYLTCERGSIELTLSGQTYVLAAGDVVVFRGDQRHGYRNRSTRIGIAYSVIAFAPIAP
ncbi:MAG: helix-turn-helix domain-containing protein [Nannocystaceae bacterium]